MIGRWTRWRLPWALAALLFSGVAMAGCSDASGSAHIGGPTGSSGATGQGLPSASSYAAPLPRPLLVAEGVSSANPAHLFHAQAWDFARMRQVFDAVNLLPGDQATVENARRAGLAVVLEFDYKADFFAGKDISRKVQSVVDQIRANPGTVAAIHVADRLNQGHDAEQGLRYLAATGGVFHREVPGVPVLVNVADRELTCGMPGQSSCVSTDPRFQYETNATLDAFQRSGYVDGFTVANNLKNNDAAVQVRAWQAARSRWPSPFILWSTSSQLSFPDPQQPGGPGTAAALVAAYMTAPMRGGAEGLALWAWHQLYKGGFYTFLDKDGSSNDVWRGMVNASAALGLAHASNTVGP